MSKKKYWKVEEVAEVLGVHPGTVRRGVTENNWSLRPVGYKGYGRDNRALLFDPEDVMRFLMERGG